MSKKSTPIRQDLPLRNLALRLFIEKTGLTKTEFCKKIGMGSERINRLFRYDGHDKSKKRYPIVTQEVVSAIAKAYGISEDWLDEEEEKLRNQKEEEAVETGIPQNVDTRPFIFNTSRAGSLTEDLEENSEPHAVIANLPYYDYTIQVIGDSMEPTFYSGDFLAIRDVTKSSFKQWGCPHVLSTRQGNIVKRIYPDEEKKGYKCVSDNDKKYPPFTVSEDEVYGVYKVVGCIHREG